MLNPEVWLPVVGFDGYSVSKFGDVYSHKSHRLMTVSPSKTNGYLVVGMQRNGKMHMRSVHRLVLEAWRGACPPGMESLHGPGGRLDASLSNLAWGTPKKNQLVDRARDHTTNRGEKCGTHKLTYERMLELKRRRSELHEPVAALAAEFGINPSTVSKIANGKRWAYPPEEW